MAKIDLRNRRPKVEKLPDGRLRATFALDVLEWVGQTKTQIAANVFIAFGTEAPNFSGLRLVQQYLDGMEPQKNGAIPLVRVYEEIPATAEVQVGNPTKITLEDGRTALQVQTIQLVAGTYTPGTVGTTTYSGDASAFLQEAKDEDNGAVRTITRSYVYAGTLNQSDGSKNAGKLLTRTIVAVKTEPSTPAGYTRVDQDKKNVNGLTVYTYGFVKGSGRISTDVSYKQNGKLKITTIRYLDTDDGTSITGTLVNDDSTTQDGYTLYTKGYAEIVDDGIISTDTETKHNGKMRLYRIVRLGSAPTAPTASLTPTPGTVISISQDTKQEDGFTLYDYRWAEGYGRVELSTDTKNGGKLVLSTVRYFATDDGSAPAGTVIDTTVSKQDGVDLTTKVYADGDGRISTNTDTKFGGKLVLTTIRYLGTDDGSTPSGTVVQNDATEQDGYVLTTKVYADGDGRLSTNTDTKHGGALVITTIRYLGTDDGSTPAGTVIALDVSEQDGYVLTTKVYADGAGIIGERFVYHDGGLRSSIREILTPTTGSSLASYTPTGVVVNQSYEQLDGVVRWTLETMQWSDGTAPTAGSLSFENKERFTYPGRAKYFSVTVGSTAAKDVFLSPPVTSLVTATHTITYSTSSAIGALANTLWNPTDCATLKATWIGWANAPKSMVKGYEGFTAVNSGASGTSGGSGFDTSVMGDRVFASSAWAIVLSGGPTSPNGSTAYTLHAEVTPAFVSAAGVQYYRHHIIEATPAAQAALPV